MKERSKGARRAGSRTSTRTPAPKEQLAPAKFETLQPITTANADVAPMTGERVNQLAFRQLSIKQIADREGCDPEIISSQFGDHYRAGRLRAAAQAKQALILKAIQGNDVRAQITLAKRYLGLSDKAPPPPPPPPTYH